MVRFVYINWPEYLLPRSHNQTYDFVPFILKKLVMIRWLEIFPEKPRDPSRELEYVCICMEFEKVMGPSGPDLWNVGAI